MATLTRKPAAIVVLNQPSVTIAHRIKAALPGATLYGLSDRTTEVDVSFSQFGDTVRHLFASGIPIVGICAAGILIRTLAPLLSDKRQEPPVIAVAEDGSAVVPLLGGLQGVNDLARQIAALCDVAPAITTAGDLRFRTALLAPPGGYHLANPDDAKGFIADLLAGDKVRLVGTAPWLTDSHLPIDPAGRLTIRITESAVEAASDCLVYHPQTVAIALASTLHLQPDAAIALIQDQLAQANLASAAVAGVFAPESDAASPAIQAIADFLNVPARFFSLASLPSDPNQQVVTIAQAVVGASGSLLSSPPSTIALAFAIATEPIPAHTIARPRGHLFIVGTGPGSAEWMSPEVKQILSEATDLVGYKFYLDLAGPPRLGQQRHEFDNREELNRAAFALDLAAQGRSVAIVSSGDPGIYAMAAAVFEVIDQTPKPTWQSINIQVTPGISALQAAAARIGAPIGHDFCAISLSDILKPWSVIEQRIMAAAEADFVIAFYNPTSKQRTWQLAAARDIVLRWRSPETPVVLARDLGRPGEAVQVRSLGQLSADEVDMRTLVLIGSSQTRQLSQAHRTWLYTPRRYTPPDPSPAS